MSPTRVHSGGNSGGKTASPSTARAINDRLALALLQREGPLTAGQLKQLTGLSRPTVADLVERLRGARLITVVGEAGAERRGPNARLYGIVADRAHLAGIDVRTDRVTVCVADLLGRTLAEASLPIAPRATGEPGRPAAGPPAVAAAVDLLTSTAARAGATSLHTIGVGAPGLLDPATGALGSNTGWLPRWHADLVAAVRAHFPAELLLENEANLAAVAEQRLGAARDRDTFVLLWLGGGTGAAVVLDGALRRGASGGAGEIGFLPVPGTGGLPSASGCEGGFHSLAGGPALCDLAHRHGLPVEGTGVEAAERALRAAVAAVRESRGERDEREEDGGAGVPAGPAEAFLDAYADGVAIGVAAVSAVLDPGCVVIGGECGRAGGDELARRVAERVARMAPVRLEVRAGTVGGRAVLRGAVLTAMEAAQDDLFAPEG
ncbi:ROK family transcriptional regulator [Streptomyces sp. AC563]|uniref:ROK family transcriptional regulator n=1 Tax=Streptomyces buecherae TaxID=2763006 RepID=UPI00164E2F0B|nr:ROK family transcriptional regulator [Streptomyces buecherae]MBC3989312.1 ROK family transcriptional regulator [Streptomyces buecherae]